MSFAPCEPDTDRHCFAPCEPGTFCHCLGRMIPDSAVQATKTRDVEAGFSPPEAHQELVGLSDRDLRLRAGDATHQHFKGGLYRLLGPLFDAATGERALDDQGRPLVAYEHVYPHRRQLWTRAEVEWDEELDRPPYRGPRYRRLG